MTPTLTFSLPCPKRGPWGPGVLAAAGERAAAGRQAPARGEPRSASRAHAPRGPHAGLHSRAHSRPRAVPRLLQRCPPQTLRTRRPAARSPGPGRWCCARRRGPGRRPGSPPGPPRAPASAGMQVVKAPWGSPPPPPNHHFYECHSTFGRNYESDGKPYPEWPRRAGEE